MTNLVYKVSQGCTLCGMCIYECPVNAIVIKKEGAHIDAEKCTGCGKCAQKCASEAIIKIEKE